MDELERISEALLKEAEELDENGVKNNVRYYADQLYSLFEESLGGVDIEELQRENETLKKLLLERLSPDEERYIKIKYAIDLRG